MYVRFIGFEICIKWFQSSNPTAVVCGSTFLCKNGLKGQCHQKCVPDRNTDIYNFIKLIAVKWFQIFRVSVATTQFFKDYWQEGKAQKQLYCTRAHRSHGKIRQIRYCIFSQWNHSDLKMLQSERRKLSIPLRQNSQPPECHTRRYKYCLYICVRHFGSTQAGHPGGYLCSEGTLHIDEAHNGMILNLRCALVQVNFLSVFTSFE
jgi:hypothetical protein